MNAHDIRLDTFMNIFQPDKKFGEQIYVPEMVVPEVIDKVAKVYDGDIEKESIIGLLYPKRRNRWKKGLVFTDYKIYCNLKKARKKKIWYDEIRSIRVRFFIGKKVIIHLDDGSKVVLKTSRRFSRKIVNFVNQVRVLNDEVGEFKGTLKYFETSEVNASMFAGLEATARDTVKRAFNEEKFHARQGHGFAAEEANNMIDRLRGKNATVVGNDNAKDGADRYIKYRNDSVEWIQSKYCKSAPDSINSCFNENGFRYYADGKPMLIEVPSDQYDEAVRIMEEKIRSGLVKGVTDPQKAREIVKKGHISYKQAVNIAKAGNIDSIMYDAAKGVVVSASAFGISTVVSLATSIWNGDEFGVAMKRAASTGVKVGGTSFLTSVLASQLSKAGLNSALVGSTEKITKMLGSKASSRIINAFRGNMAKPITGAAATKSAAKLLRTNIITSIIMIVLFSIGDFIYLLRRRITFWQFIKNLFVLTLSIIASFVGGIIGAVIGTAILPGIGSFFGSILFAIGVGSLTAHLGRKLLGFFIKDDAEKMLKIIEDEFIAISDDYLLSKNESEKVIDKLTRKLSLKDIRRMVASKDKKDYARRLVYPIVETQVKKRKRIATVSDEVMVDTLNQLLEESRANPGVL